MKAVFICKFKHNTSLLLLRLYIVDEKLVYIPYLEIETFKGLNIVSVLLF